MMFLDCPAYLDEDGARRCGLPAEVRFLNIMRSTDGPLESAMISCPAGHWFNGALESLTLNGTTSRAPVTDRAACSAAGSGRSGAVDRGDGGGRLALARDYLGEREPGISRPCGAPAYYLGRPARVWIMALGPRRRRMAAVSAEAPAAGQGQPRDRARNAQPDEYRTLPQAAPALW
jgi:hypothetical protein